MVLPIARYRVVIRMRLVPLLALVLLASGCATPVGVERADLQSVHRELTSNVLSTGELSDFTQNVLRSGGLIELAASDRKAALAAGHEYVTKGIVGPDVLFALSELAFKHAAEGAGRPYFLASAVYAFAYLFPADAGEGPSPFDPRLRWAVDLYNRALTRTLATQGGTQVELQSAVYALPFGRLEVAFDPADLLWGDLKLTEFAAAAEFRVRGLRNRYRRPGLGAPLAATTMPLHPRQGFQVASRQRLPVTAVLLIDEVAGGLEDGQLRADLKLYTPTDPDEITIEGRKVPLEIEPTASLALGLSESQIWDSEWRGFLRGELLRDAPTRLAALQPHHAGRFPVVFVHGTASSAARWADMLNLPLERSADPRPLRVLVLQLRDRQPDPILRAEAARGALGRGREPRSGRRGSGPARHGADRPQPGRPARQDERDR